MSGKTHTLSLQIRWESNYCSLRTPSSPASWKPPSLPIGRTLPLRSMMTPLTLMSTLMFISPKSACTLWIMLSYARCSLHLWRGRSSISSPTSLPQHCRLIWYIGGSIQNIVCNEPTSSSNISGVGQHTIGEERTASEFYATFQKDSFEYSKPRLNSHRAPPNNDT